jgi:deoxyadenosine/deoxycytidine kinase
LKSLKKNSQSQVKQRAVKAVKAVKAVNTMIFTLEGNIGVGKTTALKVFETQLKFDIPHVVVYEPVDDWLKVKAAGQDKSLFELYYEDKVRYGFVFQMYALQTRFEHLIDTIKANPGKIIICERTPLTDCEIFAKMMYEQGFMSPDEFMVYENWYTFITKLVSPHIRGIIYLRSDPSTCVGRIISRKRNGEDGIQLSYLDNVHKQHEAWLNVGNGGNGGQSSASNIPRLVLDGNNKDNTAHIEKVQQFIADSIANS